jgi:hypothetical protein
MMNKAERARNPDLLLKVVCEEFRAYDKYHNGIISSSAFARVFSDLQLDYAGPEAEQVMRFVQVTNDGFVHYKALMQHITPKHTAARSSIEHAIAPQVEPLLEVDGLRADAREVDIMTPTERRQFIIDRTDAIRRIYTEWDRGSLNNDMFKQRITEIGIPISDELHRIIDANNSTRSLSFSKVIQALQIGDYMLHKSRDPEALTNWAPQPTFHRANVAPRNPVSWQDVDAPPGHAVDSGSLRHYISQAHNGDQLADLKAVICAYMVGSIPTVEFVAHLDRHDIPMTQELQRLLRQQQCDNRATFRDYVKAIFPHRSDPGVDEDPGMLAYLAGVPSHQAEKEARPLQDADDTSRPALNQEQYEQMYQMEAELSGIDRQRSQAPESEQLYDSALDLPLKAKPKPFVKKQQNFGGYGDIIAWNDTPEPERRHGDGRTHRDFVSNASIISHSEPGDAEEIRVSRGHRYTQNARPVPFGTDADFGSAAGPIQPSSGYARRGYRGDRW